jgi:hypothetical protein
MCIDYRGVNGVTRKDAYPLPRVDDTLGELKDANSTRIWIWRLGFGKFESRRKMFTDSVSKFSWIDGMGGHAF